MSRKLIFLADAKTQARFFKNLYRDEDELLPLSAAPDFGYSYSQLNLWIEAGRIKAYVLYGSRYIKRSDLEEMVPPKRGRPKGRSHLKQLTPEQLGHVI